MNRITRRVGTATLLLGSVLVWATPARPDLTLYATSVTGSGTIYAVDIDKNTVTPFITQTGQADSLIFTPSNQIVYGNGTSGEVIAYDLTTGKSQILASGFTGLLADISLEPGRTSVLVSDRGTGDLWRVSLSGGKSLVGTYVPGFNGLNGTAYDGSGHLFASNGNFVDQLDPKTGAILGSVALTYADGMTYDPYSGKIFVSSFTTNSIYAIDPTTLTATLAATGIPDPDGITSDGQGNIFAASFNTSDIYQYNEVTGVVTQRTHVPGLDDLAPASGLGAPAVPEPSTLAPAALGALALAGHAWRRRRRTSS
jgi:sugar lactone lactonase YvrE